MDYGACRADTLSENRKWQGHRLRGPGPFTI